MGSEGYGIEALVLLVCGVLLIVKLFGGAKERFPPGPFAWPIIGNLHLIVNYPHRALKDMSQIYGHIIGLRLGQQRAVVVSSPELAKEVLSTHDKAFADRAPFLFTTTIFYENDVGFCPYGAQWRKQRKISMVALFTAKRLQELEHVRQAEMGLLFREIDEVSCGGTRAINVRSCLGSTSARVLMRLLQSGDDTVEVAGHNLHSLIIEMEKLSLPTIGDLIPWLSFVDISRVRQMRDLHARFDKVFSAIVAERKLHLQQGADSAQYDDLLQALLSKEVDDKSTTTPSSQNEQEMLTLHDIKAILLDMLSAGIHTIALTVEWAMAELLLNPRCFHRLRKDIASVVGEKKQLMDADVAKLSYLKSIVKEVFRLHPVLPLLIPRISREECKLQGYLLPKNTIMLVNVWALGRDEKLWTSPNEFLPERFEGKDMDVKGQHFELLPFGSGRRSCLGMPLGLAIIEATLVNLVNNYDWELPPGQTLNMEEKNGFSCTRASPVIAIPKPRVWSS